MGHFLRAFEKKHPQNGTFANVASECWQHAGNDVTQQNIVAHCLLDTNTLLQWHSMAWYGMGLHMLGEFCVWQRLHHQCHFRPQQSFWYAFTEPYPNMPNMRHNQPIVCRQPYGIRGGCIHRVTVECVHTCTAPWSCCAVTWSSKGMLTGCWQ